MAPAAACVMGARPGTGRQNRLLPGTRSLSAAGYDVAILNRNPIKSIALGDARPGALLGNGGAELMALNAISIGYCARSHDTRLK
jgi:hypothetical protein